MNAFVSAMQWLHWGLAWPAEKWVRGQAWCARQWQKLRRARR